MKLLASVTLNIKHVKMSILEYGKCIDIFAEKKKWVAFALKYHYENKPNQIVLKISPPNTESFQIKILIFFIFLLKT